MSSPSTDKEGGVGTTQMENQQRANMQNDVTPQMRNPFTGRSSSVDSGVMDPESPSHDGHRRSDSLPGEKGTPTAQRDRRMSKEWDASKVPPSRFQKREGSIFSTSSSRDSHITRKDRDAQYHAKLKEKGWV